MLNHAARPAGLEEVSRCPASLWLFHPCTRDGLEGRAEA